MLDYEIQAYKELQKEIKLSEKRLKKLKENIINTMLENDLKNVSSEFGSVSLAQPQSFDTQECKEENEKEFNEFLSKYTKTQEIEEFDKKGFQKKYPEIYVKHLKSLTPRLTVK